MLDYRTYTFLTLYDEMNYRRTAEKLNMTQAGINKAKDFVPQLKIKIMWSNSVFYTFLDKSKTSETAQTRKKVVVKVSRRDGVYN